MEHPDSYDLQAWAEWLDAALARSQSFGGTAIVLGEGEVNHLIAALRFNT